MTDAEVLRRAAAILRERSARPDGMAVRVMVKVLTDQADKIQAGSGGPTDLSLLAWLYAAVASGDAQRIREDAGLSVRQVAAAVGADPSTVHRWETGQRPQTEMALRYAKVLRRVEHQEAR
ncbi:MAG: helix-turn-helix domain-containing protein [Acidimicrobiales bacterium]